MAFDKKFGIGIIFDGVDRLTGPAGRVQNSMSKAERSAVTLNKSMKVLGGMSLGAGAAILGFGAKTLQSTMASQTALGELASVGVENLDAVENAATKFSNKWAGITKSEFITSAYDIKSGVSSLSDPAVAEFTRVANLTAKATKATSAEMTSLFATGYGIYKNYYSDLSDMEFGKLFSGAIAASVETFKTTGSNMAQAISNLGASATKANVPLEEQMAVLGMLQATMTGAEAGTKYRAFIDEVAKAGKALDLNFLDAENRLLSMPEILDRIRGKYGDTIDALERMEIQEAFGRKEALAVVELLISKNTELEQKILDVGAAQQGGTAKAMEMAEAMNKGPAQSWGLIKQRASNTMEILGKIIAPKAVESLDELSEKLLELQAAMKENPETTENVTWGIYGIGAISSVLGSLALLGTMGPKIATGVGYITVAVSALSAEIGILATALASNPILWSGLAALAGSYIAYEYIFNAEDKGHTTKMAAVTGRRQLEKAFGLSSSETAMEAPWMKSPSAELTSANIDRAGSLGLPTTDIPETTPAGTIDEWVKRSQSALISDSIATALGNANPQTRSESNQVVIENIQINGTNDTPEALRAQLEDVLSDVIQGK